jgi:hypothetical protein
LCAAAQFGRYALLALKSNTLIIMKGLSKFAGLIGIIIIIVWICVGGFLWGLLGLSGNSPWWVKFGLASLMVILLRITLHFTVGKWEHKESHLMEESTSGKLTLISAIMVIGGIALWLTGFILTQSLLPPTNLFRYMSLAAWVGALIVVVGIVEWKSKR